MSKDILFVCTGNTCRSPIAEAIFNTIFENIKATSGGISVSRPSGAAKNAAIAAEKYNASLKEHISTQLTAEELSSYKLILTMTASQKEMLLPYADRDKIMTLSEFAGEEGDVYDPYGGSLQLYEETANMIYRLIVKGVLLRSEILTATEADIGALTKMEKKYFSDSWSEKSIKTQIENGKIIVLKAFGEILGYTIFMSAADEGEILRIATSKSIRNAGIGRKLLNFAIGKMVKLGAKEIFLEVRISNESAIALYEGVGFQKIGIRKGYYDNNEDAVLYKYTEK